MIATIGAMFTTLYSVKVLYLTFLANPNGPLINYKNAHEGDIFMSLPAVWYGKSLSWVKLSNSGEALKILILNHIWKYMSGWSNYSEIVTIQNMIEREMGNRGSKSVVGLNKPTSHKPSTVKDKRVDGSWYKRNSLVFKIYSNGYRKILSNQNPFLAYIYTGFSRSLKKGFSSISIKKPTLHPYFVTGFSDGESYFSISLNKSSKMNTGWIVNLQFGIKIHKKDRYLLESIQAFFMGIGSISSHGNDGVQFRVSSIKDLQIIVDHFNNFPLITDKWSNFQLFKAAFELVKCKRHLTLEGLTDIVSIKAAMNLGLSEELQRAFPSSHELITQHGNDPQGTRLAIVDRPLNPVWSPFFFKKGDPNKKK
uniref:LAGLIDADG endonuclease n=1 Tax=Bipolaris cookei TaxID=74410 RepID=A0A2H4NRU0_9PLEO|nr:LAGLIDADG endonuclease [Bipolaris cookei]ATV95723.1 LAGLIDADG endonuclease [Bipolaris cookei]